MWTEVKKSKNKTLYKATAFDFKLKQDYYINNMQYCT